MEQREAVVDLEAADRELGCAAKPRERPCSQLGELVPVAGPRQIDVLRPDRLRVVVGEECRVLVPPVTGPLEPLRKGGMQPRAPGFWQAGVRNLARERVLDRVFAVTGNR